MNEAIIKCLSDAVQSKLFLTILREGPLTTKELLEKKLGIPQATLYRNLKKMEESGLLVIVKLNQVRAISEKVYGVSKQYSQEELDKAVINNPDLYFQLFTQFTIGLLEQFKRYTETESINIKGDGTAFSTVPFYASREDLEVISREIGNVLTPYLEQQNDNQALRSLAMVMTPPITKKEDE